MRNAEEVPDHEVGTAPPDQGSFGHRHPQVLNLELVQYNFRPLLAPQIWPPIPSPALSLGEQFELEQMCQCWTTVGVAVAHGPLLPHESGPMEARHPLRELPSDEVTLGSGVG